ncbi:hypothetical protein GCM10010269_14370 [Streptomyces humidus]|uniref:Uncharacterized protein n=1 Tax=Streptomyces humidus TaxID=52259 RepID=A0A918L1Q9_9ACTN|nr:hypothetical protein GCM10010269_14370 [Streptomyces humidus]
MGAPDAPPLSEESGRDLSGPGGRVAPGPMDEGADLAGGAMTSWVHSSTRVGTWTFFSSSLVSERNVVRAKTRAMSGSVAQKAAASSSPSPGRSAFPMITGAMAADQPR